MLSSELLRLAAFGLVIGGLGGLAVPGRRALPCAEAVLIGVGAAIGTDYLMLFVLADEFTAIRLATSGIVAVLLVCAYALYARERRLPR